MKTYFLQFKVVPTTDNEHFQLAEGALAACWVLENDPQTAYEKAAFQVSKDDWQIVELKTPPVEVTREHFVERDIGLEQYNKAQDNGLAIYYAAWARDKKTTVGPIIINSSYRPDISVLLEKQKKLNKSGRCLHYDGGHRCREIIKAHSIQRNQMLSMISQNGNVYVLSSNMSTLNKSKGFPKYEKKNINNVSTFLGFCKHHDNTLFEPIDNFPLHPTDHQVLLYAYRSLCREMFVKENVLSLLEHQVSNTDHKFVRKYMEDYRSGTEFGLNNLKQHKVLYDESLKAKSYCDIRYALFISKAKPTIAFSGLFYPEFDFMGRQVQDLANHKERLGLITFCSSPMEYGWGFLFSWHHTSSRICTGFMRSLATKLYDGNKISDLLFRMVISNCENHAISPEWWEKLPENDHQLITARVSSMVSSFSITRPTYLSEGLEGISDWHFDSVLSNME